MFQRIPAAEGHPFASRCWTLPVDLCDLLDDVGSSENPVKLRRGQGAGKAAWNEKRAKDAKNWSGKLHGKGGQDRSTLQLTNMEVENPLFVKESSLPKDRFPLPC